MLEEICTPDSVVKTASPSSEKHWQEGSDSDSGLSSQSFNIGDKMEASVNDSDEEDFGVYLKKKQSSKKKMKILEDSDSEAEVCSKENLEGNEIKDSTNLKKIGAPKNSQKKKEESEDEEKSIEKHIGVLKERNNYMKEDPAGKETSMFNSDLFDADGSDSDTNQSDAGDRSRSESEAENKEDEGYSNEDESEMSEELKAKLARMKGASKKEKPERAKRPQKQRVTDLTEIHSETQRLVRESAVRLPYHNPERKGLSVFLARTQQKQAQLGQQRTSWKHSPLPTLDTPNNKASEKTPKQSIKTSEASSKQISLRDHSQTTTPTGKKISPQKGLDVNKDKLSDHIENTVNEQGEILKTEKKEEIVKQKDQDIQKDDHEHLPEQDSGFLTAPVTSSEDSNENSSNEQISKECDDKNIESLLTPLRSRITKADSTLTPTISQLNLGKNETPTLSKGEGCIIDLEEEENKSPKNTGLKNLMDRLMKHSKSQKKKAKDVQISTVHKENVGDKDELKLETLTFHIEGDDEDDQKLQKPGAKLLKLKENLQAEMKKKRAVARKMREEAFHMNNEEGFEDEEAELTDQSDTDAEEEEEEMEEEEILNEEEGVEDDTDTTKIKNNPFVEDEAEDEEDADDEDESDEENLHLELDSDNEDMEPCTSKSRSGKKFLSSALEKTKTMDLFDDDCESESPSASQVEKTVKAIELSDRPFSQLSGEKSDSTPMLNDIIDEKESSFSLNLPKEKDTSISSMDTSFDIMASLIPAGQRSSKKSKINGSTTPDLFTPSSKGSSVATELKSHHRFSEIHLPIEDTQDLLDHTSTPQSQVSISPTKGQSMLKFNSEDDTQTLMLDAEGLLVNSNKKPTRKQLLFEGNLNSSSQEMNEELLDLCSGKFTDPEQSDSKKTGKGVFSSLSQNNTQENNMDELLDLCSGTFTRKNQPTQATNFGMEATQGNMDELLGLCSGTFSKQSQQMSCQEHSFEDNSQTCEFQNADQQTEKSQVQPKQKRKKRRAVIHESDSNDSFEIADGEISDKDQDFKNDEEDTNEVEGNIDEEMQRRAFLGFTDQKKHGKIRREFVEDEAELSGSEYDSDENYDLEDKDDQLEAESGDEEVLNEDELRNQVGRVHLKTLLDDDKRDVRLFQEMYLADGDLHSEGGRTRRFKWKNVDDDSQEDMFNNSDEEVVEEETEEEMKWRLERHQREKFIQEQKSKEVKIDEEQVLKLGKVVFKPKQGLLGRKKSESSIKETKSTCPNKGIFKLPLKKAGSFLSRSKGDLAKMAEMSKLVGNVSGPRNSRNFVFTAVSPDSKKGIESRPPPVKRSASLTPSQPTAKRTKFERSNSFTPGSIFNHIE